MLKQYFLIGLRTLGRQKALATINIIGLSLGLACFSLFVLYALNEFGYDQFHEKAKNIYRVNQWWQQRGDRPGGGEASVYTPLGPAMKADLPDVAEFVRFKKGFEGSLLRVNNRTVRMNVSFADPQFFDVFTFNLLAGDPAAVLKDPHQVVLTRENAMRLFGSVNIVGERLDIKLDDVFEPFFVGGVIDDMPSTSTIQFSVLGSFKYIEGTPFGRESASNWNMTIGIETYVLLNEGSKLAHDHARLAQFRRKYYPDEAAEWIKSGEWDGKSPFPARFKLQSIRDIHTDPTIENGPGATIDPRSIWILLAIASGVLLIACINFTTLAIGRSAGRAKEVGVRKLIGSAKKQLVLQFLVESLLLSIVSGAIGLLLAQLALPYFNQLSGRQLALSFAQYPQLPWLVVGAILLAGLVAGSYPALVLSGFSTVEVLKSKVRLGGSNVFTRSLVTLQFVLSVGMIISTIVMLKQLSFLRAKNLGFDKENVLAVDASSLDTKKIYPLFRQALLSRPEILGVTGSEIGLGEGAGQMGSGITYKGTVKGVINYPVDVDFLAVMGMQLVAGRNFDRRISTDSTDAVIVNEQLVKELGLDPVKAIGTQLAAAKGKGDSPPKTVIGVVKDFHFEDLRRLIRPQMFTQRGDAHATTFFVRIRPGDPSRSIALLEKTWKSIVPELPLRYSFLDEDYNRFYQAEERWSHIAAWAGGIAIFLACFGLFGLSALAAVNRTKEIGIRKTLGATVPGIVALVSKEFLKLVLVALLIASPVAWYFMHQWLLDFAYRISMGWGIFALTAFVTTAIALFTISIQAVKVALTSPVKSLRDE